MKRQGFHSSSGNALMHVCVYANTKNTCICIYALACFYKMVNLANKE